MRKFRLSFFLLLIILSFSNWLQGQIVINEICSSNDTLLYDVEGQSSDWIELYNHSKQDIYIGDYYLSDNLGEPKKWKFPPYTIAPFEYLIVFASGKDVQYENEFHTNFKLSSKGECVVLSNAQGVLLDTFLFGAGKDDYSFSRLPNFNGAIRLCNFASPGVSNDVYPHAFVSHPSGSYQSGVAIGFDVFGDSITLHYTLNGSTPTISSPSYDKSILLNTDNLGNDVISQIPTTPMEGPDRLDEIIWKAPTITCKQAHVIRYALFKDSLKVSPVLTNTYFIDNSKSLEHEFPVLSIAVDSSSLFNYDQGIYIPGYRFDHSAWDYWPRGNYHYKGDSWERSANLEYFDTEKKCVHNSMVGMRMHGYSSVTLAQKSFKLYFRKEYGQSRFYADIFPRDQIAEHKRLIVRNGGNDFMKVHFRDALLQDLLNPIDIEIQHSQPSCLYINGEYWGTHNLRQRFDEHYFEQQHDIPEDSLIIVGACGLKVQGNGIDYRNLIDFVKSNDLTVQENYEFVEEQIDVENYIQYNLAQIYYANADWPGNNYKMWKTTAPDSKWRWLVYDTDMSFGFNYKSRVYSNTLENATVEGLSQWPSPDCATVLLRNLLENTEFKTKFLLSFYQQQQTIFKAETVLAKIDSFTYLYEPEMENHINRWHYPSSISNWYDELSVMRDFAEDRGKHLISHFKSYFGEEFYNEIIGIEDFISGGEFFEVYPNPSTNGLISIDCSKQITHIQVCDVIGNVVYVDGIRSDGQFIQLNLATLPSGVYFISVNTLLKQHTKKLVIE